MAAFVMACCGGYPGHKKKCYAGRVEVLVAAAKDWAGWQDPDSLKDQERDADLRRGAVRAAERLREAVEDL